jgi:predicted nuclease of predicted toxin-antitoxin system
MRFLVDAQLPPALSRWLSDRGHIAEHVAEIGLATASDAAVWQEAIDKSAVVVTKDEDFAVRKVLDRTGPAVVWVRTGNTTRRELLSVFDRLLPAMIEALARGEGLVEVR